MEKLIRKDYIRGVCCKIREKVEEKKETNDLIDIVLHGQPVVSNEPEWSSKAERLSTIADRAYEKEKEIYISPFSAKNLKLDDSTAKKENSSKESKK